MSWVLSSITLVLCNMKNQNTLIYYPKHFTLEFVCNAYQQGTENKSFLWCLWSKECGDELLCWWALARHEASLSTPMKTMTKYEAPFSILMRAMKNDSMFSTSMKAMTRYEPTSSNHVVFLPVLLQPLLLFWPWSNNKNIAMSQSVSMKSWNFWRHLGTVMRSSDTYLLGNSWGGKNNLTSTSLTYHKN